MKRKRQVASRLKARPVTREQLNRTFPAGCRYGYLGTYQCKYRYGYLGISCVLQQVRVCMFMIPMDGTGFCSVVPLYQKKLAKKVNRTMCMI